MESKVRSWPRRKGASGIVVGESEGEVVLMRKERAGGLRLDPAE